MRAQATAASQPAWPAPTTTMSNCSVNCTENYFTGRNNGSCSSGSKPGNPLIKSTATVPRSWFQHYISSIHATAQPCPRYLDLRILLSANTGIANRDSPPHPELKSSGFGTAFTYADLCEPERARHSEPRT